MFKFRLRVICILIFGGALMIATRLFYLQIIEGAHWQNYAEQIRLSRRSRPTYRGRILAADGTVLAADLPAFDMAVRLSDLDARDSSAPDSRSRTGPLRYDLHHAMIVDGQRVRNIENINLTLGTTPGGDWCIDIAYTGFIRRREPPAAPLRWVWKGKYVNVDVSESRRILIDDFTLTPVERVAQLTGSDVESILQVIVDFASDMLRRRINSWDTRTVVADIDYDIVMKAMILEDEIRGFFPIEKRVRRYSEGDLASHIIGYMARLNPDEYEAHRDEYAGERAKRYFLNDTIGRAGIEAAFNEILRGARGEELVERDRHGLTIRVLREIPSVPGCDVHLTLMTQQQRAAEEVLGEQMGAVVVLDVHTGEVLVLASSPRYDPSRFSADYAQYRDDHRHPLLHRAISAYPLGSTFKIVTSYAAWSKGIPQDTQVECTGAFRVAGLRCSARWGHGSIGFHEAMAKSCNVYFCELGYRSGRDAVKAADALAEWAAKLGFDRQTGIELRGESAGYVPSAGRRMWDRGERWYGGDTVNYAVGQGELLVTPLQTARMMAAVATNGRLVKPHIVKCIVDADGNTVPVPGRDSIEADTVELPAGSSELMRRALTAVVHDRIGTARKAFEGWEKPYKVAGKTSTAQRKIRDPITGEVRPANMGWFVGFAPADSPRIAFAVMIEDLPEDGGGGSVAAPIARKIIESFPDDFMQPAR